MSQVPEIINRFRKNNDGKDLNKLVDAYYELMGKIETARRGKDGPKALQYSMLSLALIEPLIVKNKKAYGSFDIKEIPAIDNFALLNAVAGNEAQLRILNDIINFFPELEPWQYIVEEAYEMMTGSKLIYDYVKENPGCFQKEIRKKLEISDATYAWDVFYLMVIMRRLRRIKKGNTYSLFIEEKRD